MNFDHSCPVVVGIPTLRRPQLLRALLRSLSPEVASHDVLVIVADNDGAGEDSPKAALEFARSGCRAICVPVAERGLAAVRNALVGAATQHAPHWRWLVMLDDDGEVLPGWFAPLISTGERFEADVVAGPVMGPLPPGAGRLARNSVFAGRKRWPTGLVPTLNGAQNICISRRLVDRLPQPWFRREFSVSGGEDYDFFRRVRQVHGRLAWCDEAAVVEPPPPSVLTTRGLLRRYASTGTYMAVIDGEHDGVGATRRVALRGFVGSAIRLAVNVLKGNLDGAARSTLALAHHAGRIAGSLGVRSRRYASPAAAASVPTKREKT